MTRNEVSGPLYSVCSQEGHSRNRPIAVIDKTYACMHVQQSLCHFNFHVLISKIYRMIFHCKIVLVGNQIIAYKSFAKKKKNQPYCYVNIVHFEFFESE